MATDERSQEVDKGGREPLTPAKQKRLEKIFEYATKKTAAATDFDFVTQRLTECVLGDLGNVTYVRAYLENLQKKYNNNRKGSPLAAITGRGARSALRKALDQQQWDEAIQHGLSALTVNPWDIPTLLGMSTAAGRAGDGDCELFYLTSALRANTKDPEINRRYAIKLTELGMLEQAIACWHRVEEALPNDDEAKRAVAVLTVRRARSRGEYDEEDEVSRKLRVRDQQQHEANLEQKLQQKIQQDPNNLANYLELSIIFTNDERYKEAQDLLAKAFEVSDGDPDIREKWEDAELRYLRQKIARAEDPAVKKKLQQQFFEKDVEVCKNRVERYPSNLVFRYELGYRYMLTKQYAEAIRELQAAKNDPRRKGACMLALGQCFQHIKQYRLAKSHYEAAIQEIPDRDADNKKRALYLAGRLELALKDIDSAEKHLTTLAGFDFTYRDVSALLDKIAKLRENPESAGTAGVDQPKPETGADQQDRPAPSAGP